MDTFVMYRRTPHCSPRRVTIRTSDGMIVSVHHADSAFFYANAAYQRSAVVHLPSAFYYDLGTNLEYESYVPTVIHAPLRY